MAITYDAAANKITVTSYTEGTPCNFTDLYNADKGGTLSLHARTGITGVDGAAVAVDRAERPTNYVVLGGASNDLYITIANWVGTTATIQITGTNRDGAAQTENIVVTANGDYSTTKWFKTITHTQVTAFTATSFDYDLTQGQWGVVWKESDTQFYLVCHLYLSTGYFKDTAKDIKIDATTSTYMRMGATAHFQLGDKDVNGDVYNGCKFEVLHSDGQLFAGGGAGVKLYDSYFNVNGSTRISITTTTPAHEIIGCIFENTNILRIYGANSIVKDVWMHRGTIYGFNPGSISLIDNMVVSKRPYGLYVFSAGGAGITFKNVVTKNITTKDIMLYQNCAGNVYVIDCTLANWNFNWQTGATVTVWRQYTFNLKVVNKDGNNIDGATVKVWDKDTNLVIDTTTSGGAITEQVLSRGYYNLSTGDTLQDYSPHKIEIRKAGTNYLTYEKKFTLDEKIDWRIAMVDVSDIVNGITDIKGTGFVKDTDSLVDIRPETDKIQTGIIDTPNNFKADVTNLDVAVSTRSSPSDVLADTNKKVPADLEDVPTDSELDTSHGSGSWEGASASSVASAVWDEDLSGHTTPNTAGKIVSTIKKIVSFIRASK